MLRAHLSVAVGLSMAWLACTAAPSGARSSYEPPEQTPVAHPFPATAAATFAVASPATAGTQAAASLPRGAGSVAPSAAPPTVPGHSPEDDPSASAPLPAAPAVAPLPALRLASLEQVLDAPVQCIALDPDQGKVAALGAQPWLYDGKRWKPIPLPAALAPKTGEHDEARIYFGRDHQPRIMGSRLGEAGPTQLYLRFRRGAWHEEPKELGSLAGKPSAAIYGVLGWDDPEVVCKVGEICLVKERRGWSQVPLPVRAPKTAQRVDLGQGQAYALLEHELVRLGKDSWIAVGSKGPWQGSPAGAWVDRSGGWVSVPAEDALYRHGGTAWKRYPSPVHEPRGLWANRDHELWVAGSDGVGYFDGEHFWRVADLVGPFAEIRGRADELWFGGAAGVWTARRP